MEQSNSGCSALLCESEVTMTNSEKQRITELRRDGAGVTQIADTLCLSVNTVKAFLRRNRMRADSEENPPKCKHCGKALIQQPKAKTKKFCGDVCRFAWWRAHRGEMNSKNMVTRPCHNCGKNFEAYEKANQKYCSHFCYVKDRFGGG